MLWLKQFRNKKLQSVMIFFIIGLCTLLISGSLIILTSLQKPYQELVLDTDAADIKFYPYISSEFSNKDWMKTLENIDGVKKVTEITAFSVDMIKIQGIKKDAFLDICEYNKEAYENVRVLEGSLENLKAGTCGIPSALANNLKIGLGSEIEIKLENHKETYQVVAIYADIYSVSTAYTEDLIISTLPDDLTSNEKIYLTWLEKSVSTQDFIKNYTEENNGILDMGFRTASDCILNASITENILGGILFGISVSVFLLILIIMGYIVDNSIKEDQINIAVYKAIGYDKNRIASIYMVFYQVIIGAGSVVGVLFSNVISSSFMNNVYKNLGIEDDFLGLEQRIVCVLFINAISFLMIYLKIRKLHKIKPVEILTGSEDGLGIKKQKVKKNKKETLNFSAFSMAIRMITREKKNTVLVLITCFLSIYIVNIGALCLDNLKLIGGETNYYWLGIDKHDVAIENIGSVEEFYQICQEIEQDSQVKSIMMRNYGNIELSIPYHQLVSAMVYESFQNINLNTLEGRNPQSSDEIALGNICLIEMNLDIGDYIEINLDGTHMKKMLIVGSFQGYYNMGRGARVLGSTLDENNVNYVYDGCSVILKDGVDKQLFIQRMEEEYGDYVKIIDRKDLYKNIMSMICEPQEAAISPLVYITAIIGAVNLFYIVYANNGKKKKTYAIYKSIGYPAGKLVLVNCIYVGLIGLVSIGAAILSLVYIFPQVMILSMSSFGFAEYKMVFHPIIFCYVNVALFIIFIGTTILSSKDLWKNQLNEIVNE